MGNICLHPPEDENELKQKEIAKKIDQDLIAYSKEFKKEHKLLLLGPGESGKSTLVKQLRYIYANCYQTDQERIAFVPIIALNAISSMHILLNSLPKSIVDNFNDKEMDSYTLLTEDSEFLRPNIKLTKEISEAIKIMWQNDLVKQQFERRHEVSIGVEAIQIADSAKHFFTHVDRIANDNYVPTIEDLLYSRLKTTGVSQVSLSMGGYPLLFVDVGGQRSERRKWVNLFEEVNAIFFVVALSEFDQKLREDPHTNRMTEAIDVFAEICHISEFKNKDIILFLNKSDLFEEKIQNGIDPRKYFPDYSGKGIKEGEEYFKRRFQAVSRNKDKLHVHITTATNTGNIRMIFEDFETIFLKKMFADAFPYD
eukprot:TRINITY_DN1164_c0_g1_i1.p1 TRINITY_DN1164_c0_g1~~TRINITY_DN1164_c0_g1_i1.p1  ORF type:complete len:392 (+),score=74.10 TRINITY_DN1164_c0_g1_i1:75-1178(+)